MKYELIDCCPVPHRLAPTMRLILAESGATLQSCYRANDVSGLLAQCGKHSQTWLFEHQGRPEQPNPANPPGRSTHELRNDGVAYPGPAGIRLPYWCVGIDLDDAHVQAFLSAARKHKYIATITYPGSRLEYHHVNFRREPKLVPPALKLGSRGPRAQLLKRRLHRLGYLKTYVRGPLKEEAVRALKEFQRDHKLTADGIAGPATQHAIKAAVKRAKRLKARKRDRATEASGQALALIKEFEGFRAKPYQDSVGVWTIGYGETKGVTRNSRPVTEAEATQALKVRVRRDYAPAVAKVGVPLNQNQFDALTSFAYNLGAGILGPDHTIGEELRAKRYVRAADSILLYDKAGGRALAGLTRRRKAERALFLKPVK